MSVPPAPSPVQRVLPVLKRFVIALLFGTMLIRVALIATDWNFGDISAYWLAAERLKHGEPLYLGRSTRTATRSSDTPRGSRGCGCR